LFGYIEAPSFEIGDCDELEVLVIDTGDKGLLAELKALGDMAGNHES